MYIINIKYLYLDYTNVITNKIITKLNNKKFKNQKKLLRKNKVIN